MADNVTIPTTGSGTATPIIATDDIATVHYQIIKLALGAANAVDMHLDSGQQTMANSVPVVLASDQVFLPTATATFDHGRNTDIDAIAEQIYTTSVTCKHGVWVMAHPNNTGTIYLGNSDVTAETAGLTDGWPLYQGKETFIKVDNVNKVYAIGSAANQVAFWRAE